MPDTKIILFRSLEVPVLEADNRVWFRATRVCKILGFSNAFKTVTTHCANYQYREWQVGSGRPAIYLTESGVYRLMLRSKNPAAIEFQDWVCEEVLPAIRKEGAYIAPDINPEQAIATKQELDRILAAAK